MSVCVVGSGMCIGDRVTPENRDENFAFAGAGLKAYLSRGFVLRGEYRSYVLFTQEDDNRNLEEWKLGFSVLF